MRILLPARWVAERGCLDTLTIPEVAHSRGHDVDIIPASLFVESGLASGYVARRCDVVVCRFSSDPLASFTARRFAASGIPLVGADNGITSGDDQEVTLARLHEASLPIPRHAVVRRLEDVGAAVAGIGLPVVTKDPLTMGGTGVRLASSVDAAAANLTASMSGRLVIQRYYAESQGRDLRLFVVDGRVIGAIQREAADQTEFRANLYLGGMYRPHQPTTAQARLAIDACKAVGLDIAGVDLISTRSGDLILEVNHNPGASGIPRAADAIVDLAEKRARDL